MSSDQIEAEWWHSCSAWGTPAAIAVGCKYNVPGARIAADPMGIEGANLKAPNELQKEMTDKVVALMKEIGIPSLKATGYNLENCQDCADAMQIDAIFLGVPKEGGMSVEESKEFIKVAYEAYQ